MDVKLKLELIREAQKHLTDHPQDYAHEISHHYRTWLIAKDIACSLAEVEDLGILEVICWWHDVKVPSNERPERRIAQSTAEYVSNKLPDKIKDIVLDSIANHEFGSSPKYIEGQILQDADKLEILSEERIRIIEEAVIAEKYDKNKFVQSIKMILREWLPLMPERYHFDYSKQLHKSKVEQIINLLNELLRKYSKS